MKSHIAVITLSLGLAATLLSQQSKELPLSEVPSLIQEVIQNQRRLDGAASTADYVSTVKVWTKRFDRKGQLEKSSTQVFEHYPATPRSITILTETDGIPTAPNKLERERLKAIKEMERFLAAQTKKKTNESESVSGWPKINLGVFPILRNSEFYAVGHDVLDGRKMLTLQFRPKPGWIDSKGIVHQLSGTLWIDASDKIVAKAKAWVATMSPVDGLFFEEHHKKVFDDTWAKVYFRLNPAVRPELFKDERVDWSFENYNFQRYSVGQGQIKKVE
jgi:hypothetical protein